MTKDFWFFYRIFLFGLLGLLIGSFLNVCIYRLPRKETIVRGHSYCPHCHHHLSAKDLIPLLSYFFLHRRCRYCNQPISPRYARIESVTAIIFILTAWLWGDGALSPAREGKAPFLNQTPDFLFNILVILCVLAAFSSLLVWAVILYDRQRPPLVLYLFCLLPTIIRLILQPQRLPSSILAAVTGGILLPLAYFFKLRPSNTPARQHETIGMILFCFCIGFSAFPPVLATGLILQFLAFRLQSKSKESPTSNQLQALLPSILVLVGFVSMLFL